MCQLTQSASHQTRDASSARAIVRSAIFAACADFDPCDGFRAGSVCPSVPAARTLLSSSVQRRRNADQHPAPVDYDYSAYHNQAISTQAPEMAWNSNRIGIGSAGGRSVLSFSQKCIKANQTRPDDDRRVRASQRLQFASSPRAVGQVEGACGAGVWQLPVGGRTLWLPE